MQYPFLHLGVISLGRKFSCTWILSKLTTWWPDINWTKICFIQSIQLLYIVYSAFVTMIRTVPPVKRCVITNPPRNTSIFMKWSIHYRGWKNRSPQPQHNDHYLEYCVSLQVKNDFKCDCMSVSMMRTGKRCQCCPSSLVDLWTRFVDFSTMSAFLSSQQYLSASFPHSVHLFLPFHPHHTVLGIETLCPCERKTLFFDETGLQARGFILTRFLYCYFTLSSALRDWRYCTEGLSITD